MFGCLRGSPDPRTAPPRRHPRPTFIPLHPLSPLLRLPAPRTQAIFTALQRLLRKASRRQSNVTIKWRPLYDCLQATHLGPTSSSVHASSTINGDHLRALRDLIFTASSFWAPSALGEIVRVFEPALHALHSRAPFPALAMLYMFFPNNGA